MRISHPSGVFYSSKCSSSSCGPQPLPGFTARPCRAATAEAGPQLQPELSPTQGPAGQRWLRPQRPQHGLHWCPSGTEPRTWPHGAAMALSQGAAGWAALVSIGHADSRQREAAQDPQCLASVWVPRLHLDQTPSGHLNSLRFYPSLGLLTFFLETERSLQPCSAAPPRSSHACAC